jgi:hypothetical protein
MKAAQMEAPTHAHHKKPSRGLVAGLKRVLSGAWPCREDACVVRTAAGGPSRPHHSAVAALHQAAQQQPMSPALPRPSQAPWGSTIALKPRPCSRHGLGARQRAVVTRHSPSADKLTRPSCACAAYLPPTTQVTARCPPVQRPASTRRRQSSILAHPHKRLTVPPPCASPSRSATAWHGASEWPWSAETITWAPGRWSTACSSPGLWVTCGAATCACLQACTSSRYRGPSSVAGHWWRSWWGVAAGQPRGAWAGGRRGGRTRARTRAGAGSRARACQLTPRRRRQCAHACLLCFLAVRDHQGRRPRRLGGRQQPRHRRAASSDTHQRAVGGAVRVGRHRRHHAHTSSRRRSSSLCHGHVV